MKNLTVDNYPHDSPRRLSTNPETKIKKVTGKDVKSFSNIGIHDGVLSGKIDVVWDVSCYWSCKNCFCKQDYNATTCTVCRDVMTTMRKDFRFKFILRGEEDKCFEIQAFKRGIDDLSWVDNLDTTENEEMEEKLSKHLEDKNVNVEFILKNGTHVLHRLLDE